MPVSQLRCFTCDPERSQQSCTVATLVLAQLKAAAGRWPHAQATPPASTKVRNQLRAPGAARLAAPPCRRTGGAPAAAARARAPRLVRVVCLSGARPRPLARLLILVLLRDPAAAAAPDRYAAAWAAAVAAVGPLGALLRRAYVPRAEALQRVRAVVLRHAGQAVLLAEAREGRVDGLRARRPVSLITRASRPAWHRGCSKTPSLPETAPHISVLQNPGTCGAMLPA